MRQRDLPQTDDDWKIQSLNIHGLFFQRWCAQIVHASLTWELAATEYPVVYPPWNVPHAKESSLDIRAKLHLPEVTVSLLIECKKNNPEFVDWVFFSKFPVARQQIVNVNQLQNVSTASGHWLTTRSYRKISSSIPGIEGVCDEGREVRSTYQSVGRKGLPDKDKTKTSNAAITDASHQVVLATHAIVHEEVDFMQSILAGTSTPAPWSKQLFLPVIVTTANLYVCDFDPTHVSPGKGEIDFASATLRTVPHILFEYTVPKNIQQEIGSKGAVYQSNELGH